MGGVGAGPVAYQLPAAAAGATPRFCLDAAAAATAAAEAQAAAGHLLPAQVHP